MRVRSFPVVARHLAIWVWLGDADDADPASIPDVWFHDAASPSSISFGYLPGAANYQLYVDNILDLSHVDFLHVGTLGGGSIIGSEQSVTENAESLTVRWTNKSVSASPLQRKLGGISIDDRFDRFTEVQWFPPGNMLLTSGMGAVGAAEDEYFLSLNGHFVTPETEESCHYFFSSSRNYKMDDRALTARFAEARDAVFAAEDSPMLHAIQERMGNADLFQLKPILLRSDEAAIRVRRRIDRMLKEQKANSN